MTKFLRNLLEITLVSLACGIVAGGITAIAAIVGGVLGVAICVVLFLVALAGFVTWLER